MKKAKQFLPTENAEAIAFAEYLRLKGYRFSHIVNEQKTKNWGAIMRSKRLGQNPGVPDYLIIKDNNLLFVELKRRKNYKISPAQKAWVGALNNCRGVKAAICCGVEEAIQFVEAA
jgi:hypothetical protein